MYNPKFDSIELTFWRIANPMLNRWARSKKVINIISVPALKEFEQMLEDGWHINLLLVTISLGGLALGLGFLFGLLLG